MSAFCALYKVVLTMCSFFPPLFFIYITHCLTKTVKNTELNTKTLGNHREKEEYSNNDVKAWVWLWHIL